VKVALAALLAACVALAFGANNAKAANAGDPFEADFNYAGLNVDVTLAQIDQLVLEGEGEPLKIRGQYTNANGDFTLPKATGLQFPDIAIPVTDDVDLSATIGLDSDGSGNYDAATGNLDIDASIALTIGVSDLSALPPEYAAIFGGGTGALECKLAPIDIALSTKNGWPHAGSAFINTADLEDGAIAGAWRSKPDATVVPGKGSQATCDLIGGVLKDVGGLWLANSTSSITDMPAPFDPKPGPITCEELGKVGDYPQCEDPVCPEGQEGTPPNDCHDTVKPKAVISSVKVTKTTIKAGKKGKIKVTVKNTGDAAFSGKITLKSSNKQVKVAKSVSITVGAGKSATKTITVSTTKKAKGKATITATVGGKKGTAKVTVKKAAKKKKKGKK
jgi:hypothetical protein